LQKAQEAPKQEKGKWMWRHKSLGLLTGFLVLPRVGYRLFNRHAYYVEKIAGSGEGEHKISQLAHYLLYGFMTVMPASGIAMGK
jgi:cytochrome b561